MAVVCPECDNPLTIDAEEVEAGDTVHCDECGIGIQIVSADPLEIAPAEEAGYDEEDHSTHIEEEEE